MSLKSFIAKNLSYPLQDFVNGTSILGTLKELNNSQYWPLEKQKDYQFEKFLKLLNHAVNKVPYYKETFKSNNLVLSDIKTPDDIYKIPILTKKIAREQNKKLIAEDVNWKQIIKGVTGGTTGPPLKLLRDIPDRTYTWAAFYRWYTWMGLNYGDSYTKIWGTPTVLSIPLSYKIKTYAKDFYYNRNFINSFNLNEQTIPEVIKNIERNKPLFLRGYLSAFIQIAEYILKNNIKLTYVPKALSSTTETLFPTYKTLIEKAFNSKLYDQYGCGECNSIAFDAGDKNGLYIASEHAFLEILDDQNNGLELENGRFVITNLDNFAMPFIRYENGDVGCFSPYNQSSQIKLPCIKQVLGRAADTITLKDGSKVHGVFFTDILNELFSQNPASIHRFQVYQNSPGKIEFRIEKNTSPDKEYISSLIDALSRFFTDVQIISMRVLPKDSTGKFRYILSELKS